MSPLYSSIALVFKGFLALLFAAFGYMILQSIIIPIWNMRFYKKQGVLSYFYPFAGINKKGKIAEMKDKDAMGYYKKLAEEDQDVPAQVTNFGNRVTVLLYDPKLIKEFYSKQSSYMKAKASPAMLKIMGTGLFLAEGDFWKAHRKVISSKFHFEFLKENIPLIVSTTREFLDELAKTNLTKVNILDELQKITGEMVGRIFFGQNLNKYKINGKLLTLYLADLMVRSTTGFRKNYFIIMAFMVGINLELFPSYREIMNEVREFRQVCIKIIQERKNSPHAKGTDLLGVLLETQNASKSEEHFTDDDIVNEFVTFFIAGMDTTGHLTTMALYLLTQNPQSFSKLQEEVDQVYSKTDPVTIEDLGHMDYMQCVLKETMRLYTPAPTIFPRIAQNDHTLGDLNIKKGTSVRPTPLYNFASPKYFEDPREFKPERWLIKKEQDLEPFVFIPFSAGPRNCIGQHMAMIESKIIISEFIKKFKFNMSERDFDLVMTFSFLYRPKSHIEMDLKLKA